MYKRLYYVGIGAYILLFIFSITFYKERVFFIDMANSLFVIIKDNYFNIQNFRYVAIFTQLLPLLGNRLGASLNTLALLYSSGFVLYDFACYFICGSILKQYRFALVILLFNILFVSHTFYWVQSELPQGIALLIVLYALMSYRTLDQMNPIVIAIIFLGFMMLLFSHPLLVFPVIYSSVFFLLRKEAVIQEKIVYATLIFFLVLMQVKKMVFNVYYDIVAMGKAHNVFKAFPHYFDIYSNKIFLQDCLTQYYWIPILSVAITWFYGKRKEWLKLLLFLSFIMGYLLLINVSYPDKMDYSFYVENMYLPLSIFIALPFVFDLLPAIEKNHIGILVVSLIMVTGCVRIYMAHTLYTNRLVYERKLLDRYGDKKVILKTKNEDISNLLMVWGTPYELLLLSEIERQKPSSIIIDDKPSDRAWAVDKKKELLVNWNIYEYNDLRKCFHFTDTSTGYIVDVNGTAR